MPQPLKSYQHSFVEFLLESGALTFGNFVTKSGRQTPYFVNTGRFDTGKKIFTLGNFYSEHMQAVSLKSFDIVFGPAYKGIPLAVAVSTALAASTNKDVAFAFDRKEKKDHGDKGLFVGRAPTKNDRLVIVEDVITAGTTLKEIVPLLRDSVGATIVGCVVAVDRCERGSGEISAVQELEATLGIIVYPIVTIFDILSHIASPSSSLKPDNMLMAKINNYISEYVVQRS